MAVTYTSQYRPLAQSETQDNECCSLRVRDMADSINNTVLLVAPRIVQVWPEQYSGSYIGTDCITQSSNTNQNMLAIWPPLQIGRGPYNQLQWSLTGRRTTGSANVTITLYAGREPYKGTFSNIQTSDLETMGYYKNASITINSGSDAVYVGTAVRIPSADWCNLLLTGTNGDASTRATLYSIRIAAWNTEA